MNLTAKLVEQIVVSTVFIIITTIFSFYVFTSMVDHWRIDILQSVKFHEFWGVFMIHSLFNCSLISGISGRFMEKEKEEKLSLYLNQIVVLFLISFTWTYSKICSLLYFGVLYNLL